MALIKYMDHEEHVWEERTSESCAPQVGDYVKFPDGRGMKVLVVTHYLSHNKFDRFIEVQVLDLNKEGEG